jgi:drug/metabolite transporter (DMT)-like permease
MLVLARTSIAALLLLPIAALRDEVRPVLRRWRVVAVFAAIEIALPWVLLGWAETRISSSLTALLITATPLVGTAIAVAPGGNERLTVERAAGLALGVVGVASIVGLGLEGASVPAMVAVGVVAVCYAVGPAMIPRWMADLPSLGIIAVSLGLAAVAYVPITAVSGVGETPSAAAVGSILALAIVCTAVAFLLFFALIREIGPARATVITYVNPAVAAVLGIAVLGEAFTLGMGVGFVLVLAGSVLATRSGHARDAAASPILEAAPSER